MKKHAPNINWRNNKKKFIRNLLKTLKLLNSLEYIIKYDTYFRFEKHTEFNGLESFYLSYYLIDEITRKIDWANEMFSNDSRSCWNHNMNISTWIDISLPSVSGVCAPVKGLSVSTR